jgi:hypothetical protein
MRGHLEARGSGTWRAKVFLGQDANGRQRYLTRSIHGTKREVDAQLRELMLEAGLAHGTSQATRIISPYLSTLSDLRIASRHMPFGAADNGRGGHWRMDDNLLRFWFHFVFPYQSGLKNGLRPDDLFTSEIATGLAQHVSPVFED